MNTKIKICGFTKTEETEYANRNCIDYAGIVVFFPKSKRNNTLENASELIHHFTPSIKTVAVTVSPTYEQLQQIESIGFDFIQIHGNLDLSVLDSINLPVLKAFNVSDMSNYELYHSCSKIAGYVFDANEPGSGKTFDWNLIPDIPRDDKLFILAGGLNSCNVEQAIRAIRPDGVDVSSGVEYSAGQGKNPDKVDEFCKIVRSMKEANATH